MLTDDALYERRGSTHSAPAHTVDGVCQLRLAARRRNGDAVSHCTEGSLTDALHVRQSPAQWPLRGSLLYVPELRTLQGATKESVAPPPAFRTLVSAFWVLDYPSLGLCPLRPSTCSLDHSIPLSVVPSPSSRSLHSALWILDSGFWTIRALASATVCCPCPASVPSPQPPSCRRPARTAGRIRSPRRASGPVPRR